MIFVVNLFQFIAIVDAIQQKPVSSSGTNTSIMPSTTSAKFSSFPTQLPTQGGSLALGTHNSHHSHHVRAVQERMSSSPTEQFIPSEKQQPEAIVKSQQMATVQQMVEEAPPLSQSDSKQDDVLLTSSLVVQVGGKEASPRTETDARKSEIQKLFQEVEMELSMVRKTNEVDLVSPSVPAQFQPNATENIQSRTSVTKEVDLVSPSVPAQFQPNATENIQSPTSLKSPSRKVTKFWLFNFLSYGNDISCLH